MSSLIERIRDIPVDIEDIWGSWSKKRKIWTVVGIIALVACIVAGIFWYNSPTSEARRDNAAQTALLKHSKMHNAPKAKNAKYQIGGGVPQLKQLAKERAQNKHPYLRGQVSLPQYGIDVPIFEGTSLATLAWGGGTAKPYQEMGKGNYAVEAHNFSKLYDADDVCPNWFFSNFEKHVAPLGDVEMSNINPQIGTVVYSLDKHRVYRWIIFKRMIKDIRDPYAGAVLTNSMVKKYSQNHDTPLITLSTCYEQWGILHPDQRIVLMGQLEGSTPQKDFKPIHRVFKDV